MNTLCVTLELALGLERCPASLATERRTGWCSPLHVHLTMLLQLSLGAKSGSAGRALVLLLSEQSHSQSPMIAVGDLYNDSYLEQFYLKPIFRMNVPWWFL
jgi:hypothetical protein